MVLHVIQEFSDFILYLFNLFLPEKYKIHNYNFLLCFIKCEKNRGVFAEVGEHQSPNFFLL